MSTNRKMEELREEIDRVDAELVRLLNARTKTAVEVGKLKKEQGMEPYAPNRDKEVLERVKRLNKGPLTENAVQTIYREIISASLALESEVRVAYLGPPATFTHQAARIRFGTSVAYVACETVDDIFDTVQKQQAHYGVVPVENSTEGAVAATLDLFVTTTLKIYDEIYMRVSQCLMARIPRSKIKRIYSHPQVLGQCRQWLNREMVGVEQVPTASTARAAEIASKESSAGALAGRLAAEMYGLNILTADVQDMSNNTTRFLVIGKTSGSPTGSDKTSILFAVKHKAGALCEALERLKRYNLNMTKIESRPSKFRAWEYHFFVDIEGHSDDEPVKKALDEMSEHCTLMKILGSYPKAQE